MRRSVVLALAMSAQARALSMPSSSERALQAHVAAVQSSGAVSAVGSSRAEHNARQRAVFDAEAAAYFRSADATPPEVGAALDAFAALVVAQGGAEGVRCLDVGTGTGCLAVRIAAEARRLGKRCVVVGVDVSEAMLSRAVADEDVSYWTGDVTDFADWWTRPPSEGGAEGLVPSGEPFDVAIFNACFANVFDRATVLEACAALVRVGGAVLVTHPLGAPFVDDLRARDASVVPHSLPRSASEMAALCVDGFLRVEDLRDDGRDAPYVATWRRAPYAPRSRALALCGRVAQGYGRGASKLGVPTANLPEDLFGATLADVPAGVYCGWARVAGTTSRCVANVGYSPTFAGAENALKIVEAHLLDYEGAEFYGEPMAILLAAYQRPERKFASFPALVAAIRNDVAVAGDALRSDPQLAALRDHPALQAADTFTGDDSAHWFDVATHDATSTR